ncbi:autotransporter domain-containing protein [Mesorhizobium sp. PAMC28654]|uniref:autotransporter family protein n=1 Tax=Mesorhizobium sp. PAMC28654 TaxID=2880934 RepID=UPI001D0B783E|nr:autotransporter outer membrane beta-barrel domain-containing protein [Mesorhizobium sp. PAMC28654]UDL88682.1 autotransporter domain-containing protein [Mesorhizobium sp. PAMC28654]
MAISLFAAVTLGDDPAFSQSFTIGNGQDVGQQTMSDAGDTGTVDSGGIIQTFNPGEDAVLMSNSGQRLTNSGDIGTFGGGAFTIYSTGADATIINNGNSIILAEGDGSASVVAEGSNANIVNDGFVVAVGTNATFGIIANGVGAHVDNQGFIGVSGKASVAILGGKSDLTISNSGTIEADGIGASGIFWAHDPTDPPGFPTGLRVTNSGVISVSGTASTGIGAAGNDIVIVNSGAVYMSGAGSVGISTQVGNAVVTNSGTVFNDFNESTSTAISFGASNATLNLLAGTAIQGPIVFSGSGNTVSFGPALNAVMTFSGSGGVPQTILTGGRPFVVNGNQVAVVDITGFASAGSLVEDLADAVSGVIETRLTTPHDDVLGPRSGPDAWLSTFGGIRSQDGSGAAAGFSQALGGIVVGAERRSGDGFLGGVFVGAATGTTDVDDSAQEITHRSVFAGGYLGYDLGQRFANLSFVAGMLDEHSSRRVANNLVLGGIETARADFNGTFISPALTLGTRLPVAMGTLMPSVRLRYAGLFVGDYTETGSAADLAVARRDVHLFEVRGQLALALPQVTTPSQAWQTTLRAGVDGIAQSSGDVSATLLGQDISFASGAKKTAVRGFAGADVAAAVGHGVMLDSGFEVGYGSDNAFTARGQVRLSKAF